MLCQGGERIKIYKFEETQVRTTYYIVRVRQRGHLFPRKKKSYEKHKKCFSMLNMLHPTNKETTSLIASGDFLPRKRKMHWEKFSADTQKSIVVDLGYKGMVGRRSNHTTLPSFSYPLSPSFCLFFCLFLPMFCPCSKYPNNEFFCYTILLDTLTPIRQ